MTATLATGLLAACGSDDNGGDGQITLNVAVFGQFGFEEAGLYEEYERLHPNITIEQSSVAENADYIRQLRNRLTQNSGLADIQAIEVGNIAEMTGDLNPRWIDFNEYGVDVDHFQDWKVTQATTEDGRLIGLGTDIGPMAVCYQPELFEQAGLPSDPEELAAAWEGDWGAYVDLGEQYAENAPEGTTFTDSAGGVFNAVVYGYEERFYNADGEYIYETSPAVQDAWELSSRVATTEGMSAQLQQFSDEWNRAVANGDFASIVCPAWMLNFIQETSGERGEGRWNVTTAPQTSNWGGSFIGVPEASEHKEEAAELAAWLTAPEQQARLFTERSMFPSSAEAAEMPEVRDATNPYFQDAPTGEIFSEAAGQIPDAAIGPRDQTIQEQFTNGLVQIERQGVSPDQAWDNVLSELENALAE
ncbi:ABC transporter substrate-binding protein [Streptomyces sp. 7-21]|jgi:cellobiose transport system substrate-binding protein|uniref:ABC transporter substrate-binding protein n=1 Tax=Streptomyces sp. 7-21 TaxID=2802283 RepID=UPI001F22C277|nr:ABC transporter substrate-binding protein [Streptomyces sp. 7-21]